MTPHEDNLMRITRSLLIAVAMATVAAPAVANTSPVQSDSSLRLRESTFPDLTVPAWLLTNYSDTTGVQPAPDGVQVTLTFDGDSALGSGGCNGYSTPVSITAPDRIAVAAAIMSTRMACGSPADELETAYFDLLPQARTWVVENGELRLSGADGLVLTYAQMAAPGLAGSWTITGLVAEDGAPIALPEVAQPVTIDFSTDGSMSTTVGCNGIGGTYEQDHYAFAFESGPATQRWCEHLSEAEDGIRAALDQSVTVGLAGTLVVFRDHTGLGRLHLGATEHLSDTLVGTSWTLDGMIGEGRVFERVLADAGATIEFIEGRASGTGGCNEYSLDYTEHRGSIAFGDDIAQTLKLCTGPGGDTETAYFALLPEVATWDVTNRVLSFLDDRSELLMTFVPTPPLDISGTWRIAVVNGADGAYYDIPAGTTITFTGDTVETTVGCNGIGGTYTLVASAFHFESGPSTQMFCEDLDAAEQALRASLEDADHLVMEYRAPVFYDASGTPRLILSPHVE